MTLKQLQYVVTVAETGNITEAAKKLRSMPPSQFAGAVCETAELAAMIVFLILADDVIF